MAANGIIHAANLNFAAITEFITAPHVLLNPSICRCGKGWAARKDEVIGYGNTPAEAAAAFDKAWVSP
jgi:hypothetical protein